MAPSGAHAQSHPACLALHCPPIHESHRISKADMSMVFSAYIYVLQDDVYYNAQLAVTATPTAGKRSPKTLPSCYTFLHHASFQALPCIPSTLDST